MFHLSYIYKKEAHLDFLILPISGLEPVTYTLRVPYSTNWAKSAATLLVWHSENRCQEIFISIRKSLSWNKALRLFLLGSRTFVGIQPPVPKFEGNNKENKGNQNQTTNIKEDILALQEIAGRIVGRKGERHNKAN